MKKFHERRILLAAFGAALILRGLILQNYRWEQHRPSEPFFFAEAAKNFLAGKGLSWNRHYREKVYALHERSHRFMELDEITPPDQEELEPWRGRAPGFALLTASVFWITGSIKFFYVRVLAVLLDSLAVLLMFGIGRRLFNERVGLVSAWAYALWVPNAIVAHLPNHDAVMSFFVLLALFLFLKALDTQRLSDYAAASVAVIAGMYIRQEPILFPFLWTAGLVLIKGAGRALRPGLLMIGLLFASMLPWMCRNYKMDHRWYFLMPEAWMTIYTGIWTFDDARRFNLDNPEDFLVANPHVTRRSPQSEALYRSKALPVILEEPLWFMKNVFIRQLLRNTIYSKTNWTFLAEEPWLVEYKAKGGTTLGYLKDHPAQFFCRFFGKGSESLFFILALGGIWLARRNWRKVYFLWSIPLCYIGAYSIMHGGPSYVLPGKAPLLILSSFCLVACWDRLMASPPGGAGRKAVRA